MSIIYHPSAAQVKIEIRFKNITERAELTITGCIITGYFDVPETVCPLCGDESCKGCKTYTPSKAIQAMARTLI